MKIIITDLETGNEKEIQIHFTLFKPEDTQIGSLEHNITYDHFHYYIDSILELILEVGGYKKLLDFQKI